MSTTPDMLFHMGGVPVSGPITKGSVWFVDGDVSATGNGTNFDEAFLTITEAISAASDDDIIYVSPGTYTETAAQTVTQANLKIIGSAGGSGGKALSETYWQQYGQSTVTLNIDASNVELSHIKFVPDATGSYACIRVANGAGTGGVWINNCWFYDVRENYVDPMVKLGNASYNAVNTVISDCGFFKGKVGIEVANASRFTIRDCDFKPLNTGRGVSLTDTTPAGDIWDCRFVAQDSATGQLGIVVNGTPSRQGELSIDGCRFINFSSDDNCVDAEGVSSNYGGLNYNNHSAITTS